MLAEFINVEKTIVWLPAPAESLAARRVYVAPGTAWGDERHVRVTLRDSDATARLVGALRDIGGS